MRRVNETLRVLEKEIEFYFGIENPDWPHEKNEGFKSGLKYCYNLIKKMKETEEQ